MTLVEDGRLNSRELAERVGLSQTPVIRRVRRLESEGYIRGYGAQLDEAKIGGEITVYISVTLQAQTVEALAAFEREVVKAPEVMSCFLMSGGADYMLRVITPNLTAYQDFLMNSLTAIPGVAHIQSSFALRAILQRAAPELSS